MVGQPQNEISHLFFIANFISPDFSSVCVYLFYFHEDIGSELQSMKASANKTIKFNTFHEGFNKQTKIIILEREGRFKSNIT